MKVYLSAIISFMVFCHSLTAQTDPRFTQILPTIGAAGVGTFHDLDGDGDLDVLFPGNPISNATPIVAWIENLGERNFSEIKPFSYRWNDDFYIDNSEQAADLDGDGIVELLVSTAKESSSGLLIPLPGILPSIISSPALKSPTLFEVAKGGERTYLADLGTNLKMTSLQLNKTGKWQLLEENSTSNTFRILEKSASGDLLPWNEQSWPLPGNNFELMSIRDLDADGDRDLLFSYTEEASADNNWISSSHLTALLREGASLFAENFANLTSYTYRTSPIDFEGDGLVGLLYEKPAEDQFYYRPQLAGLDFSSPESLITLPPLPEGESYDFLGAIEKNGENAILLFFKDDRVLQVRFGTWEVLSDQTLFSGSWRDAWSSDVFYAGTYSEPIDLDGDGKIDVPIVVAISSSENWTPRPNYYVRFAMAWGTDEGFAEPAFITPDPIFSLNPLPGDFDSDGDLDLIIGPNINDEYTLFANDGRGNFSQSRTVTEILPTWLSNLGASVTTQMATADLNIDGLPDLVVMYTNNSKNVTSILYGLGNGTFTEPVLPFGSFDFVSQAADIGIFEDWDGDGDLDSIMNGLWYENFNGELLPFARPLLPTAPSYSSGSLIYIGDFAVGDLDGDGNKDYISTVYEFKRELNDFITLQYRDLPYAGFGYTNENGLITEIATAQIETTGTDAFGNVVQGAFRIVDLDLDGWNDLLYEKFIGIDAFGNSIKNLFWRRNPADGTRNPETWVETSFINSSFDLENMVQVDFNGDGSLEYTDGSSYLAPSIYGPSISPAFDFTGHTHFFELSTRNPLVTIADFDGDGDADQLFTDGVTHLTLVHNLIINENSGVAHAMQELGNYGILSNPDADADGDGNSNALEFLYGSDPTTPDTLNHELLEPAINNLTVSFNLRKDAEDLDLHYTLEESPDLVNWQEVTTNDWSIDLNPTPQAHWMSQHLELSAEPLAPCRFYRTKAWHQAP